MPFLFIHGVSVRDKKATINDARVIGEKLAEQVIKPLAEKKLGRLDQIRINPSPQMFVAFWGDVAAQFHWNWLSLPSVRLSNAMGPATPTGDEPYPAQTEAFAYLVQDDSGSISPSNNTLLAAARKNPHEFLRTIFAPSIYGGQPLLAEEAQALPDRPLDEADALPSSVAAQVLLIEAIESLAADPATQALADSAEDDVDLLQKLQTAFNERVETLARRAAPETDPSAATAQSMGARWDKTRQVIGAVKDKAGDFFSRIIHAPGRALSAITFTKKRNEWNEQFTKFTGDVFHYLLHRGTRSKPGEIVARTLAEIDAAEAAGINEPWFVVTHSMGGNIFYDILTYYRPKIDVEVWLSVGGQVGLFEEVKLFQKSKLSDKFPLKVKLPGKSVKRWINVYDPIDPFAYIAEPIFSAVDGDVEYSTGSGMLGAHGGYFHKSDFYDKVRDALARAYGSGKASRKRTKTP